jgi:hypothetical protein
LAAFKGGKNQFVVLKDPRVSILFEAWARAKFGDPASWLNRYRAAVQPQPQNRQRRTDNGPSIFAFTPQQFNTVFDQTVAALGLSSIGYCPHSLRGGGATRDFMCGDTIETILFRGRWESLDSIRTYVQSGRARLLLHQSAEVNHWTGYGGAVDRVFPQYFVDIVRSAFAGYIPHNCNSAIL